MPGSLLLGNDAYSDVSDTSGRSLDAKIGTKKVSFNKAVRVKQYPWRSDFETNSVDHLTLPSNRFWFKVYKHKQDATSEDEDTEEHTKKTAEENNYHDSLAPIAEVEDLDSDTSYSRRESQSMLNNYCINEERIIKNNEHCFRPFEPAIDYCDYNTTPSHVGAKAVWGSHEPKTFKYNNSERTTRSTWNRSDIHEVGKSEYMNDEINHNSHKLPRMFIQRDSSVRSSVRKCEPSYGSKGRERRSRSHDENLDNNCRFKQFRKADKSVSTEDLNFDYNGNKFTNKFLKQSRDIATQCNGTLNHNGNRFGKNETYALARSILGTNIDNERLNNFKCPTSKFSSEKSPLKTRLTNVVKKDEDLSKSSHSRYELPITKKPPISERNAMHRQTFGGNIISPRERNGIQNKVQNKPNGITTRTKNNMNTSFYVRNDSRKLTTESNENKCVRDSSTVGYLRGKQIPLSEVNTNTNKRFLNKNENNSNKGLFLRNVPDNLQPLVSPSRLMKSSFTSNGVDSKRSTLCNSENMNTIFLKNEPYSCKSYATNSNNKSDSVIDWSLSGFQLATKLDNNFTSISDSEYTVHQRPPLLMYIPGVSHHDRPAVEDDRLSALSDMSRSELNDGLSSLSGNDFHRRHSMPRDGKLRWMKWNKK